MTTDYIKLKVEGHLFMRDIDTNEVLVDQHNDIHIKNFGDALGWAMADYPQGFIEEMHFGSGGSTVNSTGAITYLDTNVNDAPDLADLHGAGGITYSKVVNDRSSNFTDDDSKTNIKVFPNTVNPYTDIVVTCTLDYGEPSNQALFDNATDMESAYVFDEIALKTVDTAAGRKRMLTHVIFHPVQKSLNRAIEIIYTIRISMVT
jgi:hypothetical protein